MTSNVCRNRVSGKCNYLCVFWGFLGPGGGGRIFDDITKSSINLMI